MPSGARVEVVRDKVPNKLDLLMMIDNSISMADKQELLADAMQHLVERLVLPRCLGTDGEPTGQQASAAGLCPAGSLPEFFPFADIHAAVITSSLGAHGATERGDVCISVEDDDHARLLGSIRPGLPNWNNKGFLAWDPDQSLTPPGMNVAAEFAAGLSETVEAAGDLGCGYEAPLEAWYRFLVYPEPPAAVVLDPVTNRSAPQGISAEVLAERAAFLRSDSVLAIVMLSDENDCSILDDGYGWLVARSNKMFRSTSQCLSNPNDACCQSCGEAVAKQGCPAIQNDSECAKGKTFGVGEDDLNLRCFEQKRRFGFDLLHPVERYITGLTALEVPRRSDDALVPNPIYASRNGAPPRSPEQVLLLGIVGVPWQDVADAKSLTGAGLKFLGEAGTLSEERWDMILGDPSADPPVRPSDPFMFETPVDRTTVPGLPMTNPVIPTESVVSSSSTNPRANAINGHESANIGERDLQYACTFQLATPITCDAALGGGGACDCFEEDGNFNRSLCQPPGGGPTGITQYFGKAYPGLRELQVLKAVGAHGIVTSACPKISDTSSDSYGYRPAMDALAGRVAKQLGRSCLSQGLELDADGRIACSVVTASTGVCACDPAQGLTPILEAASSELRSALESFGYCGAGLPCADVCMCELKQLEGAELSACQNQDEPPSAPGYCYLSAVPGEDNAGSAAQAADCLGAAPRRIRFSGGAPRESSVALLYCPEP